MELSSPTNTSCPTIKNEVENETPTQIHPAKPSPFSNGVLKRHHHHTLHHHHAVVVTYKECLKNHAAAMGSHAVDGCGEFMPATNTNPNDPTSLKCAACGCHRNFHRREPEDLFTPPLSNTLPALEYHPHHRHQPPPPNSGDHSSPSSPSPPPISSSYYPPPPHNLLTLTGGGPSTENNYFPTPPGFTTQGSNPNSKKRFRTKFSQEQKDKMLEFAEKVGWKFQKKDEEMIIGICNEIGIDKGVLKVWMHNNKNTLGKKDLNFESENVKMNGNGSGGGATEFHHHNHQQQPQVEGGDTTNDSNGGRSLNQLHQLLSSTTANGSSSSS